MAILKTDGVDGTIHYPIKTAVLQATGAITKGDAVMLDSGAHADLLSGFGQLYCVKKSATADSPLCVGVALETVSAPATNKSRPILVQVAGKVGTGDDAAPTSTGAISIGDLVGSENNGDIAKFEITNVNESDTCYPFAVCIKAYGGADTSGTIAIMDKGWY